MKSIVKVVLTFVLLFSTTTIVSAASYTYDELNRLTKVTYEDGAIVSYTYDAAGNILSIKNEVKGEGNDEGEEKGDQYDEMPMQSNVEPDKVWSIRFNQEVDMEILGDVMIYVKDSGMTKLKNGTARRMSTKVLGKGYTVEQYKDLLPAVVGGLESYARDVRNDESRKGVGFVK